MGNLDKNIKKLIEFLEMEPINTEDYKKTLKSIKKDGEIKLKLLDYTFYNEQLLNHAKEMKIKAAQQQNFEKAARWRDDEVKCTNALEMKAHFGFSYSTFHYEKPYLIYVFFGNAKNDKELKKIYNEERNL